MNNLSKLQITALIIVITLIIGLAIIGSLFLAAYLNVTNDYYAQYSEIDRQRFEREYFPEELPSTAFDIYKQTDIDMGAIWMRFSLSENDKRVMLSSLKIPADSELTSSIVSLPARDVEWWYKNLRQFNPDDNDAIDVDIYYANSCPSSNTQHGYFAIDRNSQNIYFWCN